MTATNPPSPSAKSVGTARQATLLALLAIVVANVNAAVDSVLHPEFSWFDAEHVITGSVTALVSVLLALALLRNERHRQRAEARIGHLETILPICSHCKRIRKRDANPQDATSWQQIESYISETTSAEFSHDICPDCLARHFPDFAKDEQGRIGLRETLSAPNQV